MIALRKYMKKCFFIIIIFIIVYFNVLLKNVQINSSNLSDQNNIDANEYKTIHFKSIKYKSSSVILNKQSHIKQKTRYFAFDANQFGSVNTIITQCSNDIEIEVTKDINKADFVYFLNSVPNNENRNDLKRNKFIMVYGMESEPFSQGGQSWSNADFRMWYDLDLSYPEPATYFDMKRFLPDLLSKPMVDFDNKIKSVPMVWILSNCAAFNRREKYVEKLMSLISIDSYGACLNNKNSHTNVKMMGNIELYSKYKFVIAIENSNCKDYVTEKLIHAVASGSIPIVAGKNGKPDYLRFMPKNSFINIYDFKSIDDFVLHIKNVMANRELYEKYIYFRNNHNYTKQFMLSLKLDKLIDLSKTIIDPIENKQFYDGIVSKEKSEDKLCKIARHINQTPHDKLVKQINENRMSRPVTDVACLPSGNLAKDFLY